MSLMLLSSYNRVRHYLFDDTDTAASLPTYSIYREMDATNWISAASAMIEAYCSRQFHIESRIQYFDYTDTRREFFPYATPILVSPVPVMAIDPMALWNGDEGTVDNIFIGVDGNSIGLPMKLNMRATSSAAGGSAAPASVRITYTGGLAYHATQSVYGYTAGAGTMAAGKYVRGGTSNAWGCIIAVTATTVTLEVMFGIFTAGETLTEYATETANTGDGVTATLGAAVTLGLAEVAPDIVRACEVQVRFMSKHKFDFEMNGAQKDGSVTRKTVQKDAPMLTEEAMALLVAYKKYPMGW